MESVIDVDESSFEREVIERSRTLPVVVDFWAPWCGPCRMLGPILEHLVRGAFAGHLVLARLNTDESPALSERYRIQGIPAVKAFVGGQVVSEFVGALPEAAVERFLASLLPSQADSLVAEAEELARGGDKAGAEARLREALEGDRSHPRALQALAHLLEERGELREALQLHQRIVGDPDLEALAAGRAARIELCLASQEVPEARDLEERLARNPADAEAHHALGLRLAAQGDYHRALEHFLEVVRLDRSLHDDGGRRAMLQVFQVVGTRSSLADAFRSRLASILF